MRKASTYLINSFYHLTSAYFRLQKKFQIKHSILETFINKKNIKISKVVFLVLEWDQTTRKHLTRSGIDFQELSQEAVFLVLE